MCWIGEINKLCISLYSTSYVRPFSIAGFLRPGLHGDVVTNFGLLDQIAALHWLQVGPTADINCPLKLASNLIKFNIIYK